MSYIETKIRDNFPDASIIRNQENESLFAGRNLPVFVKDYILRRFSNAEGEVGAISIRDYLASKMPDMTGNIKARLISGERINMTMRIILRTDIASGRTTFTIPDVQIDKDAFVEPHLIEEQREAISDGEVWANVTLQYMPPQGRHKGYISMTTFKPFKPYKVDLDCYVQSRENFTTNEWMDLLIATMGYKPERFVDEETRMEFITRLLVMVEPRLNVIELGPKSTGKSYLFNNLSKHSWVVSGGKISRAKLFYNKSTRQYGIMRHYDVTAIDEIASFSFVDPDEMQSIFKGYLEDGRVTVDNVMFQSDCGIVLMGNIPLSADYQPLDNAYYRTLPEMFRESATLDRFHAFIEGWKLPRLDAGSIFQGRVLNSEYISTIFHQLRSDDRYEAIFNEMVDYDNSCDLRDLKAIRRVATAYAKLLFPHVRNLNELSSEQLVSYKDAYNKYCLQPAIARRGIIRKQCH